MLLEQKQRCWSHFFPEDKSRGHFFRATGLNWTVCLNHSLLPFWLHWERPDTQTAVGKLCHCKRVLPCYWSSLMWPFCVRRLRPGLQTGQKVCDLRSKLLLRFPVRVSPPLIHLPPAVASGNRSFQQEAGSSDRAGCQATGGQPGLR